MMSVDSYLEHAKKQREFVREHRYSPYFWGNSTCDEILKNMDLSLLNLCKAVLLQNNIDFTGRADEEIITYVSSNSTYSRYIDSVKSYQSLWRHAARRRDRNSRNYHLACTASALETFEDFIRSSYNNSPTHKCRIYRNWG